MTTEKVPFLRTYPGAGGSPRYFWRPSPRLQAAGFRDRRLSNDYAEAVAEAERLNAEVEAWQAETGGVDKPKNPTKPGTVREMITYYEHSRFWPEAKVTQYEYRRYLRRIDDQFGDLPAREISPPMVEKYYSTLLRLGSHSAANAQIRVLRALYSAGVRGGYATTNPAGKPAMKEPERKVEPILWTDQHVEAMVETCDALGRYSVGTAITLNYWLGQRVADVVKLTRECYRDGSIWIRQGKTGARVELPIDVVAHLGQRLAEEQARVERLVADKEGRRARRNRAAYAARVVASIGQGGGANTGPIVVSEQTGRAYTRDNFTKVFEDLREEAAKRHPHVPQLGELRFTWLRHTAVTLMAEAGVPLPQIAAVTGHTLKSVAEIIEHYLVTTGKMARSAFEARLKAAEEARGGTGRKVGKFACDG